MEKKNAWLSYGEQEIQELEALNNEYKVFLNNGKTERKCVEETVAIAKANGYMELDEVIAKGIQLKAGDKVIAVGMKKTTALFHIGKKPLTEGMNILGAHIDSPRMDIKQVPLYEDNEFAYLDTHYYGGIRE